MCKTKRFLMGIVVSSSVFAASALAQPAAPAFVKVPEMAKDCWNFDSPLWEKAGKISDFKVPMPDNKPVAPQQATEVRLAQDGTNFYIRFTAQDTEINKVKPAPLDEFGDDFPRGDHAEIWVGNAGSIVLAFDSNGNKYDAQNFDQSYYSGFRVQSRRGPDRWEAIVRIPMRSLIDVSKTPKDIGIAFVRHIDHGDGKTERSTATGQKPTSRSPIKIEW